MADILAIEDRWDTFGDVSKSPTVWTIGVAGRMSPQGSSYISATANYGDILQATVRYDLSNLSGYGEIYFIIGFDDYTLPVVHKLVEDGNTLPVSGEFTVYYAVTAENAGQTVYIGTSSYVELPNWGVNDYYHFGYIEMEVSASPAPPPEPDVLVKTTAPQHVYEFEKGWGFDGKYIPHFVELNWWFGDSPVINTGIQKLRVHGLSKGKANLTLAVNSMSEPRLSYDEDYSEPQWIDLPREQVPPTADFVPVTNYTDTASRGISTQLKFEGRPDTTLEVPPPEPPHVLQVLVIQGSPAGTGATSN